jgi:hypothetical protein
VEPLAARWWGPVGSADIGHHLPLLGLVEPADAVDSVGSVGVAAVGTAGALAGQPVAAVGSSDDRPGPVVVGGRDSRCTARPPRWRPRWRTAPRGGPTGTARPLTVGGEGARIERSKHRAQGRGGRPARRLAVAIARWRTASGLRAGMPRPWRVKALRSDSQIVPRWVAALTLPSRSANAKARSASPRSARNRLGCQPSAGRPLPAVNHLVSPRSTGRPEDAHDGQPAGRHFAALASIAPCSRHPSGTCSDSTRLARLRLRVVGLRRRSGRDGSSWRER